MTKLKVLLSRRSKSYKKLSYRRGTARRSMLVSLCSVSRGMAVRKISIRKVTFKVIQGHWHYHRHTYQFPFSLWAGALDQHKVSAVGPEWAGPLPAMTNERTNGFSCFLLWMLSTRWICNWVIDVTSANFSYRLSSLLIKTLLNESCSVTMSCRHCERVYSLRSTIRLFSFVVVSITHLIQHACDCEQFAKTRQLFERH